MQGWKRPETRLVGRPPVGQNARGVEWARPCFALVAGLRPWRGCWLLRLSPLSSPGPTR